MAGVVLKTFIVLVIICILAAVFASKEYFSPSEWSADTEIIIVTSHFGEDLGWLTELEIPVIVCGKEGEKASPIPSNPTCKTPNAGFEASSYLRFIYENYTNLPRYIAFIHGHETAWHQHRNIVEEIRKGVWKQKGYYGLNKFLYDDHNSSHHLMPYMHRMWPEYFEPYLHISAPDYVCHDCCAQFIVSRDRILVHPREVYKKWYELSINNDNEFAMKTKDIAIVFEWIWHVIFGEPLVVRELFKGGSKSKIEYGPSAHVVGISANQ
jgi:hypothetical protein